MGANNPLSRAVASAVEETIDLIQTPFATDEYRAQSLKNQARTIELLTTLVQQNGQLPEYIGRVGDDAASGTGGGGTGTVDETLSYFATGTDGKDLTPGETYETIPLGFKAKTVNIRCDTALYMAFADPEAGGHVIPIGANDLPFTIGGPESIDAEIVYLRPQDTTASATVDLIAYR